MYLIIIKWLVLESRVEVKKIDFFMFIEKLCQWLFFLLGREWLLLLVVFILVVYYLVYEYLFMIKILQDFLWILFSLLVQDVYKYFKIEYRKFYLINDNSGGKGKVLVQVFGWVEEWKNLFFFYYFGNFQSSYVDDRVGEGKFQKKCQYGLQGM